MSIYLDHAATTPPRPEAREALTSWLSSANASSPHAAGQLARTAVEGSREVVASALGCSPHEVVFTSGGTESDNLAIKGISWAHRDRHRTVPHVVTSAVEHPAVSAAAQWLAERGDITLTVVGPQSDGRVDPERVLDALTDRTVLVSVMLANNELGSINDVAGLQPVLRDRGIFLHTDAVQAIATLPVTGIVDEVDALAASAHKFGGPQGVGFTYLRRGMPVAPLAHGGGQDRGVRSGTFATGLIAACAAALSAAVDDRASMVARLRQLSDRLADGLLRLDGVRRDGPADPGHRLASHVHITMDGVDPDALTVALDRAGLAASPGAACGSGAAKGSAVLEAVGAVGTPLRLTLGWTSQQRDVDRAIAVLTDVVGRLRAGSAPLRPVSGAVR